MADLTPQDLRDAALDLAMHYAGMGLDMTLRQLYYQLVATAQIPNSDQAYKRLGGVLTKARYEGDFPLDLIIDRTRSADPGSYARNSDSVECALALAKEAFAEFPEIFLGRDRWLGQPYFVTVMVEKEALAGVFEAPCRDLGVASLVCRGYPSVSALNEWVTGFASALEAHLVFKGDCWDHQGAVILYFGDHDPDGLQIPKSLVESCERLMQLRSEEFPGYEDDVPNVHLVNCALTLEQIRLYDPPPFPAKKTSSRFKAYRDETGLEDAWELDALSPGVLRGLVREHVNNWFDPEIHASNEQLIEHRRAAFKARMREVAHD